MIELEIQALAASREGLLIDVGRLAHASGFTLQRQRLKEDPHGILLTIVVRGPPRKKRALEAALDACERIISFELSPFVDGDPKPHFAASRRGVSHAYVPAPLPEVANESPAAPAATLAQTERPSESDPLDTCTPALLPVLPSRLPEPEFLLPSAPAPAPEPAPALEPATPYVERVELGPDEAAVEKALRTLSSDYPGIMPRLLALDRSVAEGSRESSLDLAGRRTGAWVFERDHAAGSKLDLRETLERVGVPALSALVEVEQDGSQLHIRHSPLCTPEGHSGCMFFSGFLHGLLGPALVSSELSIFAVCCRSYGADDCVLALSD